MLQHIDQLDKKLTNNVKSAAAWENLAMNVGLISGLEKDSNSTLHFLIVPNGNSREGEALLDWKLYALELDPRTSSTADGSLKELQVIACLSDTESYELLDKECVRLEQD